MLDFLGGDGAEPQIVETPAPAPDTPQGRLVKKAQPKYFLMQGAARRTKDSMLSGADDMLPDDPQKRLPLERVIRKPRLNAAFASREGFGDLVEITNPTRPASDLILGRDSMFTLLGIADEVRRGDDIRRHGLPVRSKLLFCGPPGCGKSLCAEVVASELHMPLATARLDAIIASHLGETATNLRKIFEAARQRAMVLFLDEFDALARARNDATEHSEIRRVVNSLLMMIDRFDGPSILIAATNLEETVDRAIWRRFDEVVIFDKPTHSQIRRLLRQKTKNFKADFDIAKYSEDFSGMSYAQIERVCLNAIRSAILLHRKTIPETSFRAAIDHELRRFKIEQTVIR